MWSLLKVVAHNSTLLVLDDFFVHPTAIWYKAKFLIFIVRPALLKKSARWECKAPYGGGAIVLAGSGPVEALTAVWV